MELTLSIIKPDAVKRNLIGKINSMIEKNKIKIVAQKMIRLSIQDAQNFYGVHKERAFFDDLCNYMISGPIVVQVLQGSGVVSNYRELVGATNPENADENTIRKLYGESVEENCSRIRRHGKCKDRNRFFLFKKRDL